MSIFGLKQLNEPKFAKTFLKNLEQHANFISRYNILKLDLMTESKIFSEKDNGRFQKECIC